MKTIEDVINECNSILLANEINYRYDDIDNKEYELVKEKINGILDFIKDENE